MQILYRIDDLEGNFYLIDMLPVHYCNWWIIPIRVIFLLPFIGLIFACFVARFICDRWYSWRTIRRPRGQQANTPANFSGSESLPLYDYSNQQDLYRQLDLPDGPNHEWICPETDFDLPITFSDCEPVFDFIGTDSYEIQLTSNQPIHIKAEYIHPLGLPKNSNNNP